LVRTFDQKREQSNQRRRVPPNGGAHRLGQLLPDDDVDLERQVAVVDAGVQIPTKRSLPAADARAVPERGPQRDT
jgi:hypothetical protein